MKKNKPSDGLGPHEISKIRSALRQCWQRSAARKIAIKRCTVKIGDNIFYVCEECDKQVPQIKVDHIEACGDVDEGFISRMFCPSSELMCMCNSCHKVKTTQECADKKKLLRNK